MPELPEVEITARRLREALPGRAIRDVAIPDPRVVQEHAPERWRASLTGSRVAAVGRRAKYLIIECVTGAAIVAHLRMTGKLAVVASPEPSYLRFSARLDDERSLCFHDPRRLGQLWLLAGGELATFRPFARLGPDALEKPSSAGRLAALGADSGRTIKAWLMDQAILGGLGNICAGEILFRVGVAPTRAAGSLTGREWERLAEEIPSYLRWAIDAQRNRPMKYLGERDAENPFALYGRTGTPCPRCGSPIRRIVVAGRGTYFCPICQGDGLEQEDPLSIENRMPDR